MDIERSLRARRGGRRDPVDPDDRHAHAHRLADHHDRALCGRGRQGCRDDRAGSARWAIRSPGTTWAAASGSITRGARRRPVEEFARVIVPAVKAAGCRLAIEPGRVIAGNAGILLSRVLYTKQSGEKRFLIQDAAMNDLIRPALYESYHRIWPAVLPPGGSPPPDDAEAAVARDRALGRRRPRLRERRLPGQGPPPAPARPRRPARHLLRRRLRHGHGLQLQHPSPRRRSPRRWAERPAGPPPRDLRGPRPARSRALSRSVVRIRRDRTGSPTKPPEGTESMRATCRGASMTGWHAHVSRAWRASPHCLRRRGHAARGSPMPSRRWPGWLAAAIAMMRRSGGEGRRPGRSCSPASRGRRSSSGTPPTTWSGPARPRRPCRTWTGSRRASPTTRP